MRIKKDLSIYLAAFEGVLLLSCLLIPLCSGRAVASGVSYFVFQFFCVFVPGLCIWLFVNKDEASITSLIAFSYFYGTAVLLLEYLITVFLHQALLISVLVSLLAIYGIYVRRKKLEKIDVDGFSYLPLFILVLILVLCFYGVTLANPVPSEGNSVIFNKDFLYWVGTSIAFTKDFPVQDFRLVGFPFYYHYFSNVIVAQSSFILHMEVSELSFLYSYIFPCVLMSYGSFVMFDRFLKNKFFVVLGVLFALFTEGSVSFLASHLYFCAFGFDYAYGVSMLGIAYLYDMYRNDRYTANDLFVTFAILVYTTVQKGPVCLVVLIAYGIVAFDLLLQKRFKTGFLFGLVWLGAFVGSYALFLVDITGKLETTNGLMFLGPLGAFNNNVWAIEILSDLIADGMADNGLTRILALLIYIWRNNRVSMCLLAIASLCFLWRLIKEKKADVLLLSLLCIGFFGILLTIDTYQDGNSQMYFIMSMFPYGILAGLYGIESLQIKKNVLIYCIVALLIAVSYDDLHRFVEERAIDTAKESIFLSKGGTIRGDKRYAFSYEEYEMALWLKENTEEDDRIALDYFEYGGKRKEEILGIFSCRYIWNDGQYADAKETSRRRKIVEELFEGDRSALEKLQKEKVSYVIETLPINPQRLSGVEQVYASESYIIYKVK